MTEAKREATPRPLSGANEIPDSRSPERMAWDRMKRRCYDKSHVSYKDYGAVGVRVSSELRNSFAAFFHCVGRRPTAKHSLDRIDVNGDYEAGNIRWATREVQANNRTDSVYVRYRGKKMTLTQAWRAAGKVCSYPNVFKRFNSGWDVEKAVETPPNPIKRTRRPSLSRGDRDG